MTDTTAAPSFDIVAVGDDIKPIPVTRTRKVDTALADKLFAVASASKNGASNGKDYPSVDDKDYKSDARKLRYALASKLADNQRAVVVPFENGKAVRFAVVIKTRKPRDSK